MDRYTSCLYRTGPYLFANSTITGTKVRGILRLEANIIEEAWMSKQSIPWFPQYGPVNRQVSKDDATIAMGVYMTMLQCMMK